VAVGDFNRDGALDLAVANFNSNNVSVLLGKGDGTFRGAPNISFGRYSSPSSVAVGNFHGDGTSDLALVAAGRVSVALGNGDGTFRAPVSYDAGVGPVAVAAGDFKHNGILDLAVADEGTYPTYEGSVSVLFGNGDGSFQTARTLATGWRSHSIAVGDFNGDGILDLAVANYGSFGNAGSVSVLLGNGDGSFRAAVNYWAGGWPVSVAVGDFDRDVTADLAVANGSDANTVSVLLANSDGTFRPAVSYPVGRHAASVAVGDFRHNGILDLVVANQASNSVSMLLGNGDGTFQPAVNYDAGSQPVSVVVGDFNGDGILDLAVASSSNAVRVLLGKGDGSFQITNVSYIPGRTPRSLAVGDFNGDGWPDLAVANEFSGDVSILLNDGSWPAYPGASPGPGGRRRRPDTATNVGDVGTALVSGIPTPTQIGYPETMRAGAALGPPLALTILDSMFARPVGINSVSGRAAEMEPPAIARSPARARSQGVTPWMLDDLLGWHDCPGTQMLQEEAEPVLGIE
jgi:hypothetical protein